MSPQQESSEREWPEVKLYRWPDRERPEVYPNPTKTPYEEGETYLPESSPQVLSKSEAEDVRDYIRMPLNTDDARRVEALYRRLKDWADS